MKKLDLFPSGKLEVSLQRLCHQLIEEYGDFENTALLGLQPNGIFLGKRIHQQLKKLIQKDILYGEMDVTFHRDDIGRKAKIIQPNSTKIDFMIEGCRVILIDDVLYTGRTVRAAMDAMLAFGRPRSVELLVLVDRRHSRELPIDASYVGITVDSIESEKIIVKLKEAGGEDQILLINKEEIEI